MPPAEFDDQAAGQAGLADPDGEFGRGRPGPAGVRLRGRVDEFDADHQSASAHVADRGEFPGQRAQPFDHPVADHRRPFGQPVGGDVAQCGGSGGHGQRVAAEGAGVGSGPPAVVLLPVDDDGEREAAADRLGEHHRVGHDPAVLDRPHRPGAAHAGLHLVDDQRDAALGGDPAHGAQPVVRRGDDAALALDGLQDHRGGRDDTAGRVVEQPFDVGGREFGARLPADPERAAVAVGVGQPDDLAAAGQRLLDGDVAGEREGSGGHPVVGAGEGEGAGAAGRGLHQLERGLDGVGPGGPAEVHARAVGEGGRQALEQGGGEVVLLGGREVEQVERGAAVEGAADRLQDHGVVVAEREGAGAGEAVEVAAAVGALDGHATGAHGDDREGARVGAGGGLAQALAAQHGARRRPGPGGGLGRRGGRGNGGTGDGRTGGGLSGERQGGLPEN